MNHANTPPTRRQALGLLGATLLAGCDATADMPRPGARGRAGLLLPLTGPRAGLGEQLRLAATLGGEAVGAGAEIEILDAGDDDASAVRAAEAAVSAGAQMLVGPLFSAQARAVAGAVGRRVPVVALSNDDTLAPGAFVYGVTPLHSARAVLGFAASRGLRDVAVAVPPGAFGERAAAEARVAARETGIALRPAITATEGSALRSALGAAPDALYLPSAGPELGALAGAAGGAQILGSAQWSALPLEQRPELDGAWYAAPDPLRFAAFARALEAAGGQAGIVAGLVFDAVEMARLLGRLEQQDRRGLTREKGFEGVLGPYRLRPDGRAERGLAVLGLDGGAVSVLGTPA